MLEDSIEMFGIAHPEQRVYHLTPKKKAEGENLQLRWRNISPADVQGFIPSVDTLKVVAQKG